MKLISWNMAGRTKRLRAQVEFLTVGATGRFRSAGMMAYAESGQVAIVGA